MNPWNQRRTRYEYNPSGRLKRLIVENPATGVQETEWEYGVTQAESDLASNELVRRKVYPDSTLSSDVVSFRYNRRGQVTRVTDQNGWAAVLACVHGVLDVVGLIPVAGEIADGANAVIYLCEGDYANATLSAAGMIPVAGDTVKVTGKAAKRVTQAEAEAALKKARKEMKPNECPGCCKKKSGGSQDSGGGGEKGRETAMKSFAKRSTWNVEHFTDGMRRAIPVTTSVKHRDIGIASTAHNYELIN